MKEIGRKIIFPLLEFLLGDVCLPEDGDIEGELLALEHVGVEEVDDLATVLPGPRSEDSGSVHSVLPHVVVKEWVEVQVGHAAHLSL